MIDLAIIQKAYAGDITPDVRLYVENSYKEIFNKDIANPKCQNCIADAAIEIFLIMQETRKYILYSHHPVIHKGKVYVAPTITDEVAEEYLKEHPEDTFKFKKIPKKAAK